MIRFLLFGITFASLAYGVDRQKIWQDHSAVSRAVFRFQNIAIAEGVLQPSTQYAVVRTPYSARPQLLANPNMISYLDRPLDSLVLVKYTDLSQLVELSQISHSLGCGTIIGVDPQKLVAEPTTAQPPLFHTTQKLTATAALLEEVSSDRIIASITELVNLGTRQYDTSGGLAAPTKIQGQWQPHATALDLAISTYNHSSRSVGQESVVATITGTKYPTEIVVFGAHLDSINKFDKTNAPGADDDATGIATLTEMLATLAAVNATFERTIEFHAYAAEEVGLVGSRHIAQDYQEAGKNVVAMMQFDMTGYSKSPATPKIFLVNHDTVNTLRQDVKSLVQTYLGIEISEGALPTGATSDHKAWFDAGYPAVFPFEDPKNYNPYIHSKNDVFSHINNPTQLVNFTKLGLAFAAHFGGLEADRAAYDGGITAALKEVSSDLFLAFQTTASGHSLAISAPQTVASVSACLITAASAAGCSSLLTEFSENEALSGRKTFLSDSSISAQTGEKWRVSGFDSDAKLVQMRQIEIE